MLANRHTFPKIVLVLMFLSFDGRGAMAQKNELISSFLQSLRLGEIRILDLTHEMDENSPYWPEGSPGSPFRTSSAATFERDGYFARNLCLPEHFGTHLDAPAHFDRKGLTVDRIPVKELMAEAIVIDVSAPARSNPDYRVSVADVARWEKAQGALPNGSIVLFHTGWDARWPSEKDYMNQDARGVMHFPGLSLEAARYVLEKVHPVAIGIDTSSIDYGASKDFAVHHLTHSAGLYHLENLTNLKLLPSRGAFVIALPLKLRGGSGSPVHAVALVAAGQSERH